MRGLVFALVLAILLGPEIASADDQSSYSLPEVTGPLQRAGTGCSTTLAPWGDRREATLGDGTVIHATANGGAVTTVVLTATRAPAAPLPVALGIGRFIGVHQMPWAVVALQSVSEPAEDHFLISRVQEVNMRNGKTRPVLEFRPDYDTNLKLWRAGAMPAGRWETLEETRLCGDCVFVAIGDKVYRYAFADPKRQHPLLVSPSGSLVLDLNSALIAVDRSDRRWALSIGPDKITRQSLGPGR